MNSYALSYRLILGLISFACLFANAPQRLTNGTTLTTGAIFEGGDFTLTNHDEKRFELKALRGRVALLYFGYATCTEACPMMLAKVSTVFRRLGPAAEKVTMLLVTLDPARDTPDKLKKYLRYFKVNGIGLTGKKEEIDRVVGQYGARYLVEKLDSALGYHINHTTDLYVIDRAGKLRQRFKHDDKAETIAQFVKGLLD